jgi:hypothetical protein
LLQDYGYRPVIRNFIYYVINGRKNITLFTATPIPEEYLFPELKALPYTDMLSYIEEHSPEKVTIFKSQMNSWKMRTQKVKSVESAMVSKCMELLEKGNIFEKGRAFNQLFIALNSVKSISTVVKALKDKGVDISSKVRVVASNTATNEYRLDKLGVTLEAASSVTEKPITLFTSTAFQSCDFYSPNGLMALGTTFYAKYTQMDAHTTIPQVLGRIRNAEVKEAIHYICFNRDKAKTIAALEAEMSNLDHEFKRDELTMGMSTTKEYIKNLKTLSPEKYNAQFIRIDNDVLSLDTNLYLSLKYRNYYILSQYTDLDTIVAEEKSAMGEENITKVSEVLKGEKISQYKVDVSELALTKAFASQISGNVTFSDELFERLKSEHSTLYNIATTVDASIIDNAKCMDDIRDVYFKNNWIVRKTVCNKLNTLFSAKRTKRNTYIVSAKEMKDALSLILKEMMIFKNVTSGDIREFLDESCIIREGQIKTNGVNIRGYEITEFLPKM